MTTSHADSNPTDAPSTDNPVADEVDDQVREKPWLQKVTRLGWVAKGIVYILFGVIAVSIARQESSEGDEASPTGALNKVMEQPGGRVLLGVLALGLILYSVWRFLSVAVIRDNDMKAWLDRIGFTFSGIFYAVLAFTAARTVLSNREAGESNTIENLSQSLLETTWGRWLLGIGGVVTIAVGGFFTVRKGLMRSFVKHLDGVSENNSVNHGMDHFLVIAGVVGWIGRGIVTMLVGFFVARAAWRFDPDEARGFDRALREAATTGTGTVLVWASAVGLVAYGAFCLVSSQRRALRDQS